MPLEIERSLPITVRSAPPTTIMPLELVFEALVFWITRFVAFEASIPCQPPETSRFSIVTLVTLFSKIAVPVNWLSDSLPDASRTSTLAVAEAEIVKSSIF